MNATDTRRPTPQTAERWTPLRIFRAALAITLGVVAALVVTFALLFLLLA